MKQYCRYCCHFCTGNGIYCEEQQRTMSEAVAKAPNRCHSFVYNPIDAFNLDKEYKPREPRKNQCDGQMKLFDFINKQDICKIDHAFHCNHAQTKF